MRKVYTLNDFIPDLFNSIDDFLSNFASEYTLVDAQDDRRVYRNISQNLDLIFYKYGDAYTDDKVALFVSTNYDSSKEIWFQENIIVNWFGSSMHDISEDGKYFKTTSAYYYPAPTLSYGDKLVANYNSGVFMFSVIRNVTFSYIFGDHVAYRTMNLVFGNATKYLEFAGGFFYGGDMVYSYEKSYTQTMNDGVRTYNGTKTYCYFSSEVKDPSFHIIPRPPRHQGHWPNPWRDDPYSNSANIFGSPPDPDKSNRLDLFLRCDIDEAPNRGKDKLVKDSVMPEMPLVTRNATWAITPRTEFYVQMGISITNEEKMGVGNDILLPRYEPIIAHDSIEEGHTVNTLNNISLIMPLWFMVMRDPIELKTFSAIAKSDIINFVDMFNMDTDKLKNGTFPTIENYEYDCFQMGNRRAMYGMKGYSGLAFKQESEG